VARKSKQQVIEKLIREFRVSGNQDDAFDSLAAERLGVSETDLRCLNIIENSGGLTAGDLAAQSGLTAGDLAAQGGLTAGDLAAQSGLTAGDLAAQSGLTGGAITGVIDRLERVGYARRVPDPADRRRVRVEVTPAFYKRAERIWGPVAADWQSTLSTRFTIEELERITDFLRTTNQVGRRHLNRLREGG
jgi:DNA-binding MarR family transcriptional regulator